MKPFTRTAFAVVFLFAVVACTANVGLVPPEQMSPRELATYAMSLYNSQYNDYMARVTLSDLSDVEKTVLKTKRASLVTAWPILRTFAWYVDTGQVPPAGLQAQVITWLNSVRY